MSLLPLEEVRLAEIDLTDYTPVELTMVSVDSIFTGSYKLTDDDSIMWTIKDEDDYKISHPGDYLDLSLDTAWREDVEWEMIVGDESQLGEDNIRYIVPIQSICKERTAAEQSLRLHLMNTMTVRGTRGI